MPHKILVADDEQPILDTVSAYLRQESYQVVTAGNGRDALFQFRHEQPDLVVLDVMMPEMDGYQVLSQLQANPATADIPVIFVTALDSSGAEERGLALGVADYITKPIRPSIVLARVRAQIELKAARDLLRDHNRSLQREIDRRMAENLQIQDVSIRALGRLAEIRDPETGNHLRRTQGYVRTLAMQLRFHPRFAAFLTAHNIEVLVKSAPLHDIGKVGIPDHILLKPGQLTADEWVIMKTHSRLGYLAIEQAEQDAEHRIEFLSMAKEIAHYHHEKWDGSGYPDGLAGDVIPISARLMALADVFDALLAHRVYKAGLPVEEALQIIRGGRGCHFDPDVVDAFFARQNVFLAIAAQHAAGETPPTSGAKS